MVHRNEDDYLDWYFTQVGMALGAGEDLPEFPILATFLDLGKKERDDEALRAVVEGLDQPFDPTIPDFSYLYDDVAEEE